MLEFFNMIRDFWSDILGRLNGVQISIGSIRVPFGGLIFAFLVVGIVVSVFWKGAKT